MIHSRRRSGIDFWFSSESFLSMVTKEVTPGDCSNLWETCERYEEGEGDSEDSEERHR